MMYSGNFGMAMQAITKALEGNVSHSTYESSESKAGKRGGKKSDKKQSKGRSKFRKSRRMKTENQHTEGSEDGCD
jgi:hypothetical protein